MKQKASERADDAINELNTRFREHGIGFQFVEGEIVRVDSELIHSEAVKPALRLLNEKNYHGAQQEFFSLSNLSAGFTASEWINSESTSYNLALTN